MSYPKNGLASALMFVFGFVTTFAGCGGDAPGPHPSNLSFNLTTQQPKIHGSWKYNGFASTTGRPVCATPPPGHTHPDWIYHFNSDEAGDYTLITYNSREITPDNISTREPCVRNRPFHIQYSEKNKITLTLGPETSPDLTQCGPLDSSTQTQTFLYLLKDSKLYLNKEPFSDIYSVYKKI